MNRTGDIINFIYYYIIIIYTYTYIYIIYYNNYYYDCLAIINSLYMCIYITLQADYDTGFFRVAEVVYDETQQTVYIREFEDEGHQRPTQKQEWFDYNAVS